MKLNSITGSRVGRVALAAVPVGEERPLVEVEPLVPALPQDDRHGDDEGGDEGPARGALGPTGGQAGRVTLLVGVSRPGGGCAGARAHAALPSSPRASQGRTTDRPRAGRRPPYVGIPTRVAEERSDGGVEGEAGFPGGPEDPKIALIRVECEGAEYWDSPSSTLVHAYGYLKAVTTGEPPHPGANDKVDFTKRAG